MKKRKKEEKKKSCNKCQRPGMVGYTVYNFKEEYNK